MLAVIFYRYLREQRITRLMTTPSLLATILNTRGIDFPRYLDLAKYVVPS